MELTLGTELTPWVSMLQCGLLLGQKYDRLPCFSRLLSIPERVVGWLFTESLLLFRSKEAPDIKER